MDPKPAGLSPRSTVRGRPRTTSTREDPCARCGRNIPDSQPDGQKADSATSATSTPSTLAAPAPSASKLGSCRARPTPTDNRSAQPARASRMTSTANAATSNPDTTAAGSARDAPCAMTSTGCSAVSRAPLRWSGSSTPCVPRTAQNRSSSGNAHRRCRNCFAVWATGAFPCPTKVSTLCLASKPSICVRCCSTMAGSPSATLISPASSNGSTPTRRTPRRRAPTRSALRHLAPPPAHPRQVSRRRFHAGPSPLGQIGDH